MEQGVFIDYQVLYRKYRPHDFYSLLCQEFTKKFLKNSLILYENKHYQYKICPLFLKIHCLDNLYNQDIF